MGYVRGERQDGDAPSPSRGGLGWGWVSSQIKQRTHDQCCTHARKVMKLRFNKMLSLFASFTAVITLTLPLAAHAQNAPQQRIDRIVAFGTSLTDTGNAFIWLS